MTSELQKTVGRRLRERRRELGLSQEAMAEQLGYHRTFLGSVERGERNLTLASVEQLATSLGVPALDLLRD
ncbi:helix-turn-helix domain-containing protein [Aeromicrobium fastidiosum]|uniref:helix-turn-helix domain-containing protein n=1 Tax=Aeromicrobium fastidiosum TaxID=52699 RepID=UPI001DE30F3D|nr:helix-turn-helix transcriptional regulator [Aeromicrobium fastidiosum]MBP2389669.1 transcriptional regulator with XRE-family HTH domain [Aeromicrobium fastidiosum]